jgi:hypothetical protein
MEGFRYRVSEEVLYRQIRTTMQRDLTDRATRDAGSYRHAAVASANSQRKISSRQLFFMLQPLRRHPTTHESHQSGSFRLLFALPSTLVMVSALTCWFRALSICLSEVCLACALNGRLVSLFMVGRSIKGTRPTIMFTLEDKELRKDAFMVTKVSGILRDYPGFEAHHLSFGRRIRTSTNRRQGRRHVQACGQARREWKTMDKTSIDEKL